MSEPRGWSAWASTETAAIEAANQWRQPREFDPLGTEGKLAPDGRAVVSYASNDYLGLTQHPGVIAAAHAALDRYGTGSGSARLIVGARPVHSELERALARWKHEPAAVLFPTGFAANLGVLTTFGLSDALICSDELNHASIIDGCRMSRAEVAVFRHRDLGHLAALLRQRGTRRAVIVTDTVFSMDGDIADIPGIVALASEHDALLVLDEAHGVLGPDPGAALHEVAHLRVGTLSKTLGALGGFVAGPRLLTDLLINRARSYIFTTAPTPADTAAALAAVTIIESPEGLALIERLRDNVTRFAPHHCSPIVPIVCGSEATASNAANALLQRGLLVPAIRPPTVAPGTARLRVAISALHSSHQLDELADALRELGLRKEC